MKIVKKKSLTFGRMIIAFSFNSPATRHNSEGRTATTDSVEILQKKAEAFGRMIIVFHLIYSYTDVLLVV